MAISRAQLAKELEPGLNALFGLEYDRYEKEHEQIFETETSDRAFEEETMLSGFGTAPVKAEGAAISFDDAQETFTARYTHETIALAFSITEEAIEDNLYDRLAARYTRALARSMSQSKQIKAASILNNAFSTSNPVGDGAALCSSSHPSISGNQRNLLSTASDLNETSLEQMLIDIAGLTDERGLKIAVRGMKLIIPNELQFIAERVMNSNLRSGTSDNDINAIANTGVLPGGYTVNHYLNDPDAFFLLTSITDQGEGLKMFQRTGMETNMEPDFSTGNIRYKARERYSFGWSNWRGMYGSQGA